MTSALWKDTTQTVFGEGPAPAPLMLVGEQPGDREDREIAVVDPVVVVALGATAAKALLGSSFRVSRQRTSPRWPRCSTPDRPTGARSRLG